MTGPGVYRRSDPESWDPERPRSAAEYLKNNIRRKRRRRQRLEAVVLRVMIAAFVLALWLTSVAVVLQWVS